MKALQRQEASQAAGETLEDTSSTLTRSKTTPADSSELPEADGLGLNGVQRRFTGATLVDRAVTASPESTPSMSEEDVSEFGAPVKPAPASARKASGPTGKPQRSGSNVVDPKAFPPSPMMSDDGNSEAPNKSPNERTLTFSGEPVVKGGNAPNIIEVVAEAMRELSKIRQREQSQRPLRIVPQDPVHRPDDSLRKKFQDLANDELKVRRLNARDWLRVATWWLLKASTQGVYGYRSS